MIELLKKIHVMTQKVLVIEMSPRNITQCRSSRGLAIFSHKSVKKWIADRYPQISVGSVIPVDFFRFDDEFSANGNTGRHVGCKQTSASLPI